MVRLAEHLRHIKMMTILKVVSFRTWEDLIREAFRLEKLGYICEVRGWNDMRFNRLTVSTEDMKNE